MRALLVALVRIAQRTGRFTVAQATDIYNGLWRIIGFALLACVAAFVMNAGLGLTTPSLVLAIVFAIVAVYVWAKPLHILVVAGAGLARSIATDAALAVEVEEVLRTYLSFLKWVLLAGVTFLFITGTISFKEHPGTVLPILVALGVYGLFTWAWPDVFTGTWGRRLVYWYAILVIALSFGNLIPGAVWAKYTGWDPTTVKPTATADKLYRLDKTERERDDADRAKELERITDKIKRHEELTEAEEQFVIKARQSQVKPPAPVVHATSRSAEIPPASVTQPKTLTIPPGVGQKSERILVPFPNRLVMLGEDYRANCKYNDGHEESFIPGKEPKCSSGDVQFVYATNLKEEENIVAYYYRSIK